MRLTAHGHERLKQRGGLNARAATRIAARALERGIAAVHTCGHLRRYMDGLYLAQQKATNARIYGEFVYLFGPGDVLITAFQVPRDLRASALKAQRRRAEHG